jgi:hypothetical protein
MAANPGKSDLNRTKIIRVRPGERSYSAKVSRTRIKVNQGESNRIKLNQSGTGGPDTWKYGMTRGQSRWLGKVNRLERTGNLI